MPIGVIVLLTAFVYCIVLGIIFTFKDQKQTGMNAKNRNKGVDKNFILGAVGVGLVFIAYMMIIPTPEAGNDRWFNSVLILRLFWKTFGSLFATVGSFFVTLLIGAGIGSLFTKNKKKKLNWKSLDEAEARQAFEELYANEIRKLSIATASVTNPHEGYYGRFNTKMEQVAKNAPLAEIRIAAIQKLRNKNQLESYLIFEKDENVRKAIEARIADLAKPFH